MTGMVKELGLVMEMAEPVETVSNTTECRVQVEGVRDGEQHQDIS